MTSTLAMDRARAHVALMNRLPIRVREHITTAAYAWRDAVLLLDVRVPITSRDIERVLANAALAGKWDDSDVRVQGRDVVEPFVDERRRQYWIGQTMANAVALERMETRGESDA